VSAAKRIHTAAAIVGGWTAAGLFFGTQLYAWWPVASGKPISWGRAFAINLPFYYLWAAITPPVVALARRYPFERSRWRTSLLVHLPASVLVTGVQLVIANAVLFPADFVSEAGALAWPRGGIMTDFFRLNFHINYLTYWGVVALVLGNDARRKMHQRELTASQLRTRLVQAELSALQMQLHPHFVFNTLNSIAALIPKDPAGAERMLVDLAAFLRLTLRGSGREVVSLSEELQFLELYLHIEQTRLGDRLTVEFGVPLELLQAEVPYLLLQPLVENAVKHGVSQLAGDAWIAVSARRRGGRLTLQVADNGPGLSAGRPPAPGIGLANTRARLANLYGDEARLELRPAGRGEAGGGLLVSIEIPIATRARSAA